MFDSKMQKDDLSEALAHDNFTSSDGSLLTTCSRDSISNYLKTGSMKVPALLQRDRRFEIKRGCFVTLSENTEERSLRGCVGFPEPIFKLSKALCEAAVSAATADSRFHPVKIDELDELLVEVSLLTAPSLIEVKSQKDLAKEIVVGRDGLIMRWTFGSGLLLPQVATEYNWDSEDFLANLSMKAGAPPDQWLVSGTLIYRFRAQVFSEESPKGRVVYSEEHLKK